MAVKHLKIQIAQYFIYFFHILRTQKAISIPNFLKPYLMRYDYHSSNFCYFNKLRYLKI